MVPAYEMIITISGVPGSGKTSIGKLLAQKLGYRFYSMGDIMGQLAKAKGMTLEAFCRYSETDPAADKEIDEHQRLLGLQEDNLVIEGRTSWHFIPQSIKIFVIIDEQIAAQRIVKDRHTDRSDQQQAKDVQEQLLLSKERLESDQKRYLQYYGVDFLDQKNYDLIIDNTQENKIEEHCEKTLAFIKKNNKKK